MRRWTAALAAAVVVMTGAAGAQQTAAPTDRFVGTWQGTLVANGMRLRLGLEITRDSSGALRGVLTSIDQGNARIPASPSLTGDTIEVAIPAIRGGYAATLTPAGDSLRGTWRQGAGALPLAMGRVAALATLDRPQEPKPPFPYRTEEVSFASAPGVRLAGTLTLPAGTGPFPAVVLVTGSGPQDRDEALMGHKPFLVLADHLARHGIAALRFDDRGVGKSTGNFGSATSADFADDAEAAVRFLRGHAGIAPGSVGLVGHSEGGLIAPLVAARSRDVAFIVLLAGPGIPGDSILALQTRAIMAASGVDSARIERTLAFNRGAYAIGRSTGVDSARLARLQQYVRDYRASLTDAERAEVPEAALLQATSRVGSPWFRYFLGYDPGPALRRVTVPVLALNGTLDLQVPYTANLPAIEAALKAGGNRDYRVVALPRLNHLFQTATTGSPTEYMQIEETMAPAALDLVSSWIAERFGRR